MGVSACNKPNWMLWAQDAGRTTLQATRWTMTMTRVPEAVEGEGRATTTPGCVYLVGAGPGAADLLTVRAQRLIQQADVLVYDRLVSQDVLDLAPPTSTRLFVGKAPSRHAVPQCEINLLLVRLAASGRDVIRLKGGDPFIFGRGGEEVEHLARFGIPHEVVPGITAASGCLSALGIPLTHRGVATGARFVTGHCRDGVDFHLHWQSLADPDTTLVVYMGLANAPHISEQLQAAGLSPATPVLAISAGTTPEQRTCRTTLASVRRDTAMAGLTAPVLLVIGRVVEEAERIGISKVVSERNLGREAFGG